MQPSRRQDWAWRTWPPPVTSAVSPDIQPGGFVPIETCSHAGLRLPKMVARGTVELALMMTFSGSMPCTCSGILVRVCAFQSVGMQ
jgi:hypothetical protein